MYGGQADPEFRMRADMRTVKSFTNTHSEEEIRAGCRGNWIP
jgi:hypothetical protein